MESHTKLIEYAAFTWTLVESRRDVATHYGAESLSWKERRNDRQCLFSLQDDGWSAETHVGISETTKQNAPYLELSTAADDFAD